MNTTAYAPAGAQIFRHVSGLRFVDVSVLPPSAAVPGNVVSLFTGAGGMDIGLEHAGFVTRACVEIDADGRATLAANRPDWALVLAADGTGDVRGVSGADILRTAGLSEGSVQLVTGGAPCQPFSNIGLRRGADDPRNGDLFLEFVRIVRELRPRGFIFENVAGITQKKHAAVIDYMTRAFDGLGYELAFHVVNAADYGVPQMRRRFILLGLLGRTPAFPLPTHAGSRKDREALLASLIPAPQGEATPWRTVSDALAAIRPATGRDDHLGMNHSAEMREKMALIGPGQNFKVLPFELRPDCWRSGKHQGQDTFGRIRGDRPAPTIRTAAYNPTKGRYIHPTENRGLNTAEMAVLQDFPPEWRFRSAKGAPKLVSVGRQIGNAVPPGLAEALGRALLVVMGR